MNKNGKKMIFLLENTKKDTITTQEDQEQYRNTNICWFCEKDFDAEKFRDHCHCTGRNRDPAHEKRNVNIEQKKNFITPLAFQNSSISECHLFFKKLVDKKIDENELKILT